MTRIMCNDSGFLNVGLQDFKYGDIAVCASSNHVVVKSVVVV